jgi:sigma-B regulation protein RsbU (phosphoserine phosphatase)
MDTATSQIPKRWCIPVPFPILIAAAIIFAAATSWYAFLWMANAQRPGNPVEIGINAGRETRFDPATSSIPIYNVVHGSPAEDAGIQPGDSMIELNGVPLISLLPFKQTWNKSHPGDIVEIRVRRPGEAQPIVFRPRFRPVAQNRPAEGIVQKSAQRVTTLFPLFFVLVGFAVLFLRVDDPTAWLLAALFAAFVAAPGFRDLPLLAPGFGPFVNVFRAVFNGCLPALFYIFFAVFPQRSWLDRRAPWLKWMALAFGISQALPGFCDGDPRWPNFLWRMLGDPFTNNVRLAISYSFLSLGLFSLLLNSLGKDIPTDVRRKSRVMFWGTIIGTLPIIVERMVADFTGYEVSFWTGTVVIMLLLLYPLSFAYAVVKYRVLEIPVLLRRSARYVLVQRGFFVLLLAAAFAAIYLFTHFFSGIFTGNSQVGMGLSAVFGVALVWASGPLVKRGTQRIDRAFFRSSYDAQLILQDLGEKTRLVSDRDELAKLLRDHLRQALHPKTVALFCETSDGTLAATGPQLPANTAALQADTPFLLELASHGRAWDVPPSDSPEYPKNSPLAYLSPEILVPLLARDARLVGLFVLGQPLSEEPYSREDKRLLESVAGQAAVALENIRLAERIADRMEAENRAAHEMEIARDVQSRLFPQTSPPLATMEYAGRCIQARQVGGDYYDFLDLGSAHVGFVLADISGKGIAGALLMANLQANLRSRSVVALDDLPKLLKSVNQLFLENSPEDRYATMFFAMYDDTTRKLTYANCGHNPPLVFRRDGSIARLGATASVIGLFSPWECDACECVLAPGDVLVIYTDGVTEAENADSEEFGEARLIETVRANPNATPGQLLISIQNAVQKFSVGEQSDDLTLVIGCVR